jgi:hypothetical protein
VLSHAKRAIIGSVLIATNVVDALQADEKGSECCESLFG